MAGITTVQRHLIERQALHPDASGTLTGLLWDLTLAFKVISKTVNQAGLLNVLGAAGGQNVTGDEVTKLDMLAQDVIVRSMGHGSHVCCMASEEEAELIELPVSSANAKYALAYDPLDGSSNIDVNASVGTIFSIHERVTPDGTAGREEDVLQPGRKLVAAGYVIYGSSTMLVYSTGDGVHGFTLDPTLGEFLLSHEDIRIPDQGAIYSTNEGYESYWDEPMRRYIAHVKSREKGPYKARYIGSMIADVHRTLLYGGIFLYPPLYKEPGRPGRPKLRLLYEAAPMAFVVEQAGGVATTGEESILDIQPTGLHQRCPVVIGSPADVGEYMEFRRGER